LWNFVIIKDAIHYFEPYHIDFEITNPRELNVDIIDKKLKDAAGVAIVEKNEANGIFHNYLIEIKWK